MSRLRLRLDEHISNQTIDFENEIRILLDFKQKFCPKDKFGDSLRLYIFYDLRQVLQFDSEFDYVLKHAQKGL